MWKWGLLVTLVFGSLAVAATEDYEKCLRENHLPGECSGVEYKRQDKRLNEAYKAAMNTKGVDTNALRQKQREWIKQRDSSCPETAGTASAFDFYMKCLASFTEKRADELEVIAGLKNPSKPPEKTQEKAVETQSITVDFKTIASVMYANYIAYENGVVAMIAIEDDCWKEVFHDIDVANNCAVGAFIGTTIEAAMARQEGRVPVPYFQPLEMKSRIIKQFEANGFSSKQAEAIMVYMGNHIGDVLIALMNAGMR